MGFIKIRVLALLFTLTAGLWADSTETRITEEEIRTAPVSSIDAILLYTQIIGTLHDQSDSSFLANAFTISPTKVVTCGTLRLPDTVLYQSFGKSTYTLVQRINLAREIQVDVFESVSDSFSSYCSWLTADEYASGDRGYCCPTVSKYDNGVFIRGWPQDVTIVSPLPVGSATGQRVSFLLLSVNSQCPEPGRLVIDKEGKALAVVFSEGFDSPEMMPGDSIRFLGIAVHSIVEAIAAGE